MLKSAAGDGSAIGPGNFQLARLGGSGANIVRQNLAGGYEGCHADTIPTQPGVASGPVAQGINTRLNRYSGGGINSTDYPPDVLWRASHQTNLGLDANGQITQGGQVVTSSSQLSFNFDDYTNLVEMQMAREIQLTMLPQQYPSFPRPDNPSASAFQFIHRYLPTLARGSTAHGPARRRTHGGASSPPCSAEARGPRPTRGPSGASPRRGRGETRSRSGGRLRHPVPSART